MSDVKNMTIEDARELVSDRHLWPRVRDFLWDFPPFIHASWLTGLKSEVQTLKSSPHVKRYILDSLGVVPCFHTFPKDDFSRILLLDGATLELIVKWLGALACAEPLRRVTDGATVRELKATLSGVYPDVFGYTAYFRGGKELDGLVSKCSGSAGAEGKLNGDFVIKVGYSLLSATVAHLPEPLLHRFGLKLPKAQTSQPPDFPTAKLPSQSTNLQLLLKLRFPEAYKTCCS